MRAFFNSMLGRVFVTLVGGVLASAALTLYFANGERREVIAQLRVMRAAERMEQLTRMLDEVPRETRQQVLNAASRNGLAAEISSIGAMAEADPEFAEALHERLGPGRQVLAWKAGGEDCKAAARDATNVQTSCRIALVTLRDDTSLRIVLQLQRNDRTLGEPFLSLRAKSQLGYFIFFLASLCLLAYAVASLTSKPLQRLAEAATDLGRDIEHPPLPERGPTEVRHAASAFNAMQAQIRKYIKERAQMLAAISHDLQTPLTRMRLRLEKVTDQALRAKLVDDLSAMQGMIRDGLELARSMTAKEVTQRMDFDSILDSVCADAVETGQDVTVEGLTAAFVLTMPNAMRRCLTNLIDNAVKYGAYARITASGDGKDVVVKVRDGGPGIPEDRLEAVFDAFFRLEGSRSRDTGGTGIGLTIARNIAVQHGGTLTLGNHPDGGLVATLQLPCA